jgi:hypothetical protein
LLSLVAVVVAASAVAAVLVDTKPELVFLSPAVLPTQ